MRPESDNLSAVKLSNGNVAVSLTGRGATSLTAEGKSLKDALVDMQANLASVQAEITEWISICKQAEERGHLAFISDIRAAERWIAATVLPCNGKNTPERVGECQAHGDVPCPGAAAKAAGCNIPGCRSGH